MDRFDWSAQPTWLVALTLMVSGLIVPIATAIIGKWRSKAEDEQPRVEPIQPIEVTTPWLVQNLLEMKMTIEAAKRGLDSFEHMLMEELRDMRKERSRENRELMDRIEEMGRRER